MPARRKLPLAGAVLIAFAGVCLFFWLRGNDANDTGEPDVGAAVVDPTDTAAQSKVPPRLELAVKPGDRFPLRKTIEQVVTQFDENRKPISSRETLRILLAIQVKDIKDDGRKLLRVDYRKVSYSREVPGRPKIEYDSDEHRGPVPLEAQAYRGLVDNGFEFWLGPDNRIVKMEQFKEFLERCVQHVPADRRQAVMTRFIETSGDEGVANFIDDSIGLLPHEQDKLKIGARWKRSRQVLRPVPMFLSSDCILKELDESKAVIDIAGTIAPSTSYGPANQPGNGLKLMVIGGRSGGSCTIDRATGLPRVSQIERSFDMIVQFPDGTRLNQNKRSRTTIEIYSQQPGTKTATRPAATGRRAAN